MKVIGKFKKHEYWEWRFKLAEIKISEKEYQLEFKNYQLLEKEQELLRLRLIHAKNTLSAKKDETDLMKKQYQEFLDQYKKSTGLDIKGKIIDEITFEIKEESEQV